MGSELDCAQVGGSAVTVKGRCWPWLEQWGEGEDEFLVHSTGGIPTSPQRGMGSYGRVLAGGESRLEWVDPSVSEMCCSECS